MRRTIWITVVLLSSELLAGGARADLITYSFSGTDTLTGTPVLGTFAYQTNAPSGHVFPAETDFGNVQGSLTMTFNGQTYSSSAVSAILSPGSLQLDTDNLVTGMRLGITLASANSGTVFSNLASLPAQLSPNGLGDSTFFIAKGPPVGGPGQAEPQVIWEIARGQITLLNSVSDAGDPVAPEPGALFLAALGAVGLASATVRRRSRRGRQSGPASREPLL